MFVEVNLLKRKKRDRRNKFLLHFQFDLYLLNVVITALLQVYLSIFLYLYHYYCRYLALSLSRIELLHRITD